MSVRSAVTTACRGLGVRLRRWWTNADAPSPIGVFMAVPARSHESAQAARRAADGLDPSHRELRALVQGLSPDDAVPLVTRAADMSLSARLVVDDHGHPAIAIGPCREDALPDSFPFSPSSTDVYDIRRDLPGLIAFLAFTAMLALTALAPPLPGGAASAGVGTALAVAASLALGEHVGKRTRQRSKGHPE